MKNNTLVSSKEFELEKIKTGRRDLNRNLIDSGESD